MKRGGWDKNQRSEREERGEGIRLERKVRWREKK